MWRLATSWRQEGIVGVNHGEWVDVTTDTLGGLRLCLKKYGIFTKKANFLDSGTGFWEFNYAGEACEARVY